MMKKYILTLLLGFTFNIALFAQNNLRYHFEAGQIIEMQMDAEQNIIQSVSGFDQTIKNTQESTLLFSVLDVTDGIATLEVRYTLMKIFVDLGMMQLEFDTGRDVANPFNSLLKGMIDEPFVLHISSGGEIISVEGVETVLANAEKKASDLPDTELSLIKPMLDQQFSNGAMQSNFQNSFLIYPNEPLSEGTSWSSDLYMGDQLGATFLYDWTLQSAASDSWEITGLGIILGDDNSSSEIKDLEGTSELTAFVNPLNGLSDEISVDMTMSGFLEIDQGTGPIKVDMDITSVQTSRFTLIQN